jgi:hypothetical protein
VGGREEEVGGREEEVGGREEEVDGGAKEVGGRSGVSWKSLPLVLILITSINTYF